MEKKIAKIGIIMVLTFALILSSLGALPLGDTFAKEFDVGAKDQLTAQAATTPSPVWGGTSDIAGVFAVGNGSANDPFQISTGAELAYLAKEVNKTKGFSQGKFYKLTADIVLNDISNLAKWATEPPVNKWTPIGTNDNNSFQGTFDGNGHTVSGIYIDTSREMGSNQGLFGQTSSTATIINVGVINSYIKGYKAVGAVVGFNKLGTIINCYNTGVVTGNDAVGGVVGTNQGNFYLDIQYGVVTNCYNSGAVTATETDINKGGIVGQNYEVNQYSNGAVTNCYFLQTATINSGLKAAGGNEEKMKNCSPFGENKKLTAYGSYTSTAEIKVLVKFNADDDLIATLNAGAAAYNTPTTPETNTKAAWWAAAAGGYAKHKKMGTAPMWDGTTTTAPQGSGTEIAPYLIGTAEQLAFLAQEVNKGTAAYQSAHYKLTADIVLNDTTAWKAWSDTIKPTNAWTAIGTATNAFKGVFNGNGHTVSGIYINSSVDNQGLFGVTNSTATIQNLGVINSYINGTNNVGGVVGYITAGTVVNCYNRGAVSGTGVNVGGVVGYITAGTVTNCYNSGALSGTATNKGGVIGQISGGAVKNCYFLKIPGGINDGVEVAGGGSVTNGASFVADGTLNATVDGKTKLIEALNAGSAAYNGTTPNPAIKAASWVAVAGGYPKHEDAAYEWYTKDTTATTFEIATASDLKGLANLVNGAYSNVDKLTGNAAIPFEGKTINLTANIVLNETADWEDWETSAPTNSWTAIGKDKKTPFKGVFDGQGHTVSGIYINSAANNQGLFGMTVYGATIKNVGVINSYIKGGASVGGIVGENKNGTIINCYNTGAVSGTNYVGGVAGFTQSNTATNCYNTGAVTGTGEGVGGVAGYSNGTGLINCYNTGNVKGVNDVGGVAGKQTSDAKNCYNTGSVSGSARVGGVFGSGSGSEISNCYFLKITGGINDGLNVDGAGYDRTECGTFDAKGKLATAIEIDSFKRYTLLDALNAGVAEYNGSAPAQLPRAAWWTTVAGGYPFHKEMVTPPTPTWTYPTKETISAKPFANGSGTAESPYEISTAQELANLSYLVNNSTAADNPKYNGKDVCYKLTADIVLNAGTIDETSSSASAWMPIGSGSISFEGAFNGGGNKVSGIYISGSADKQGLFGSTASTAVVRGVGVTNSYIRGNGNVGGVVGNNGGELINCYNRGAIIGKAEGVGGVVGVNIGSIINCFNQGAVTGLIDSVGGIVGTNNVAGTVTNCYSSGAVISDKAGAKVGGVVGNIAAGTVTNCYFLTGQITIDGTLQTQEQEKMAGVGAPTDCAVFLDDPNKGMLNPAITIDTIQYTYLVDALRAGVAKYNGTTPPPTIKAESWVSVNGGYPKFDDATYLWYTNTIKLDPNATTFEITTASDLIGLANLVNGAYTGVKDLTPNNVPIKFNGKTIKLKKNIVLNDTTNWNSWNNTTKPENVWTPIGDGNGAYPQNSFEGTFDGAGHTVSGIYIVSSASSIPQGLFGYVGAGGTTATIKNVGVIDSYIKGNAYAGGVVGNNSGGKVINCYNRGKVVGVVDNQYDHGGFVGGVVGNNRGEVINCYNQGAVTGDRYVGGVVGNGNGSIVNCYNTGAVTCTGAANIAVGGISGSGGATNCYNTGAVTAKITGNVGGVVGEGRGEELYFLKTGSINTSLNAIGGGNLNDRCATFVDSKGILTPENLMDTPLKENLLDALNQGVELLSPSVATVWFAVPESYPILTPSLTIVDKNIYANGLSIKIEAVLGYKDVANIFDDRGTLINLSTVAGSKLKEDARGGYDLAEYTVYGGGYSGALQGVGVVAVPGDTSITMASGIVKNIYGGGHGNRATVAGNTFIENYYGTITGDIYGGGNGAGATVSGNATVTIAGEAIVGNIYGGGNDTATVNGAKTVNVSGNPKIGAAAGTSPVTPAKGIIINNGASDGATNPVTNGVDNFVINGKLIIYNPINIVLPAKYTTGVVAKTNPQANLDEEVHAKKFALVGEGAAYKKYKASGIDRSELEVENDIIPLKKPTVGDGVVYNGFDQSSELTALITGFETDKMTITAIGSAINAGSYPVTVTIKEPTKYNWVDDNGKLCGSEPLTLSPNIAPAKLTVTASSHTVIYGDPIPTYVANCSGFVNNETVADLTIQPTVTSEYTTKSQVSASPIATIAGGGVANNYSFTYVNGTVTITPKPIAVEWDNLTPYTYNGAAQAPKITNSLINDDKFTITLSANVGSALKNSAAIDVGSYKATATAGDNYTLTNDVKEFIIVQAPVTPIWTGNSGTFSWDYDGLIHSPTAAVTVVAGSGDNCEVTVEVANNKKDVGKYTATATALSNKNYVLAGILTQDFEIAPKALLDSMLTIEFTSTVYNGSKQDPNFVISDKNGGTTEIITADDYALLWQYKGVADAGFDVGSATKPDFNKAGTYKVTVTPKGNYTAKARALEIYTRELTIAPKAITITANPMTKVYGDTDPTLTYTMASDALVGSDKLTGKLSRVLGEDVGTYAITSELANSNYAITFIDATLTITRKPIVYNSQASRHKFSNK